jgi:flavin reductase
MNSNTDGAHDPVDGFLSAMRRLAATITLITTREDGSPHGMAATAVSSLTVDPPSLLVCINRSTSIHGPMSRVKWFCVNLVEHRHGRLFGDFIGRSGSDRFTVGEWRDGPHGLPFLHGAAANVFCSVEQQIDYRTHTIFIGRVEDVRVAMGAKPLLYQDGGMGNFGRRCHHRPLDLVKLYIKFRT